jgi:hypothetical protein
MLDRVDHPRDQFMIGLRWLVQLEVSGDSAHIV